MKKINKEIKAVDDRKIVNFLFEVGILSKTPRSGFFFLGSGQQSVAEHSNRVVFIAYTLGMLEGNVDMAKLLKMALLHDLAEARVSDLNYVHQKYVTREEHRAVNDLTETLPFGADIKHVIDEYEKRESVEAILVKEADNLEWILALKEQVDIGNERAKEWLVSAAARLKTDMAKQITKVIMKTDSNSWWFGDNKVSRSKDDWWVHRNNGKDSKNKNTDK